MNVQYGSRAFCLGNMGLLGLLDGLLGAGLCCLRVRQLSVGFGLDNLATAFMKNSS